MCLSPVEGIVVKEPRTRQDVKVPKCASAWTLFYSVIMKNETHVQIDRLIPCEGNHEPSCQIFSLHINWYV